MKTKNQKAKKSVSRKETFEEYKHCLEANKPFRKKKLNLM